MRLDRTPITHAISGRWRSLRELIHITGYSEHTIHQHLKMLQATKQLQVRQQARKPSPYQIQASFGSPNRRNWVTLYRLKPPSPPSRCG